jgi:sugar transferase (PEP-CTERM/EpsH1 system associated)
MPAPIRIMHFVDGLGKGGLENGLANLIERLDPERFEHVVCAIRHLGPNAERLPRERVKVICLERKATDSALHLGALVRAIRETQPDIVHGRNWGAVEATPAGRLAGCRAVVHSEHGLETDANAWEPLRRRLFRRFAFELSHRVVSVSYQLRDLHARRTGFATRRISVIHNGVDGRRFHPDAETRVQARRELGISADEFCIGSVGNLLPVKDHMTLLKAFDRIAGISQACRLVLFGEGSERPTLEAFADAHPEWRKRVTFLGSSNRVGEMLNGLDVYVLPSVSEGISNSLLEAMATGLPVVATATGGNPEVIIDGESGLLFPVGDSERLANILLELGAKKDQRIQLGQRALRRVADNFSIDSMVRNYSQMYESLVSVVPAPMRAVAGA